jgi:fumarylacetoacetase
MTCAIDHTHDPALQCWVATAVAHPEFPIQNLPYGVFSKAGGRKRIGVAIGEYILDLASVATRLPQAAQPAVHATALNELFALSGEVRLALRHRLSNLLSDDASRAQLEPSLHERRACTMHLPAVVGDYTDFYVGIHHATNVGKLFRPDDPLLPNYKHVPIGYHGRASSLCPSGVPLRRPNGQRKALENDGPTFGATERLDYEVELGVWIGRGNALGATIPIAEAYDHIAGFCLLNDWSARDFQAWEYVPLGPFLAKNFHSTISPWVVTSEALAPFRVAQPPRPVGDPKPLPYLWDEQDQAKGALNVQLGASISSTAMREQGLAPHALSRGPACNMYWTFAQIIAHHASNGCNLNAGDLLGTGTISGPDANSYGSLLEITCGGLSPITLPTGETRTFLEDGDELLLTALAECEGRMTIGFGECRAVVLPGR